MGVNSQVAVRFDKVQKYFGTVKVLEEFNLDIAPGKFLVLLRVGLGKDHGAAHPVRP
jgi:ABC-type Fe3+/spermidine/putrescine transport system ATPase subunit